MELCRSIVASHISCNIKHKTHLPPSSPSMDFLKQSCIFSSTISSLNSPGYRNLSSKSLTSSPRRDAILHLIKTSPPNLLSETNLHLSLPSLHLKSRGKVRDIYHFRDSLLLVTTDRQSAFDKILAIVPYKGQILNQISLWWFNRTKHLCPNALLSSPDQNVTISSNCSVFPVEFVVRGFITGSTDTSLWSVYMKGIRDYCGNVLPPGLRKNQRLLENILTPTTKAAGGHDSPITPKEIVDLGLMTRAEFEEAKMNALKLFEFGQMEAVEKGLILADTKYEFGKREDGAIVLVDEVHTPDSSRYWISGSYEERLGAGLEPESVDKEFLRLWFRDHCNPYEDDVLPAAPVDLVHELAWRYVFLFEAITGSTFEPVVDDFVGSPEARISRNVSLSLPPLM